MDASYLIGADENGLGPRLGPLLVTACMARVTQGGRRWLKRRLPKGMRADLDDSKRLVSFGQHKLGEAWARAMFPEAANPTALFDALSLRPETELRLRCPKRAERQCWSGVENGFSTDDQLVARMRKHLDTLRRQGVHVVSVRCESLCVRQLNDERKLGKNRFISDLHAMERLILSLREQAGENVVAVCGKVGGISDYEKFFGPLSSRLRTCLERTRPRSSYRFPGLGELHFVQDADASDPLVMLASMIGKYVRELQMARISRFYAGKVVDLRACSGYHDPVTRRFVELTSGARRRMSLPNSCFERTSD